MNLEHNETQLTTVKVICNVIAIRFTRINLSNIIKLAVLYFYI